MWYDHIENNYLNSFFILGNAGCVFFDIDVLAVSITLMFRSYGI